MTYFAFFTSYFRATSKYKSPQGQFNGGFFAVQVWGAFIMEKLMFGILRYPIEHPICPLLPGQKAMSSATFSSEIVEQANYRSAH